MQTTRYFSFLEGVLTPNRLDHSISVMRLMGELSGVYGLNRDKAQIIGILHDAGKDLGREQRQQIIDSAGIRIHYPCDHNYLFYLHGPVGAAYIRMELGIIDPLILAAIESHTSYGNSPYFDHPLCWCLRFSDLLEPKRNWIGEPTMQAKLYRLENLVKNGKLAEGVVYQTGLLISWFEEKGFPVHPNIRRSHALFLKRINKVS